MHIFVIFLLIIAWGLYDPTPFLQPEWWARIFIGAAFVLILDMFRTDNK